MTLILCDRIAKPAARRSTPKRNRTFKRLMTPNSTRSAHHRALLQQAQTVPTSRNTRRQAVRQLHAIRQSRCYRHMAQIVQLAQLKFVTLFRFVHLLILNIKASFHAYRRLRPHVVISTGAGSVFFFVFFSFLFGSRIVIVETFSRYRRLSKFAKFSAYLSHVKILQTKSLAEKWPEAPIFDPIRILPGPPPRRRT